MKQMLGTYIACNLSTVPTIHFSTSMLPANFPHTCISVDFTFCYVLRGRYWESKPKSSRAAVHFVSEWSSLADVCSERVTGGITNTIYRVRSRTTTTSVLVRIFGAQSIISSEARSIENDTFARLAVAGIAPRFVGRFPNGRVEGWRNARRIRLDEMFDPHIMRGIASCMASMHAFTAGEAQGDPSKTTLWGVLDAWVEEGLRLYRDGKIQGKFSLELDSCAREVKVLKDMLSNHCPSSPVVFAHNDLLCGNILVSLDESRTVSFVDFEYSAYNYRGFDVGNYFCEGMGGTEDGLVDTSKYPSSAVQYEFCRTYLLRARNGVAPADEDVTVLVDEGNRFGLASHLYWGWWALCQSVGSTVDFPYLLFAEQRFAQYFATKDKYLPARLTTM